jgi:hypothetical protein
MGDREQIPQPRREEAFEKRDGVAPVEHDETVLERIGAAVNRIEELAVRERPATRRQGRPVFAGAHALPQRVEKAHRADSPSDR